MDEFDTICLDTNICDICNQDTGEELINCILNDRCLKVGDGSGSASDSTTEPFKQAHKYCLDRWKTVIRSTLHSKKCPSPNRSWKDKLKDLLHRNIENSGDFDAWVEVDNLKLTTKSTTKQNFVDTPSNNKVLSLSHRTTRTKRNSFLNREEYRVEQLNRDVEECLERGRKLRVRSVDIEDENESRSDSYYNHEQEGAEISWTRGQLNGLTCKELLEVYKCLKMRIEETSELLVTELEQKDSLRQQYDSLNTTVGQLVKMQQKQKIKTLSLQFEHDHHLITKLESQLGNS